MSELFPWLQSSYEGLIQRREQGRLPHALLLTGPAGIGKHQLAEYFAMSLLCEQPQSGGLPCGQCHGCSLFKAGTHPDLHHLAPAEDSRVIRIDQIRQLINSVSLSSHYGRHKVIIVSPADTMNVAASNSLLKTLEEPPRDTILLLISARPSLLPATIRSRCQTLRLTLPETKQAREWLAQQLGDTQHAELLLALAGGAPLMALHAAREDQLELHGQLLSDWQALATGEADPVRIAANWVKMEPDLPISCMYGWVTDMIRLHSGSESRLMNPANRPALHKLAQELDLARLYGLLDRIVDGIKLTASQVNPQTIMEGLLLYWTNMPRSNLTGRAIQK